MLLIRGTLTIARTFGAIALAVSLAGAIGQDAQAQAGTRDPLVPAPIIKFEAANNGDGAGFPLIYHLRTTALPGANYVNWAGSILMVHILDATEANVAGAVVDGVQEFFVPGFSDQNTSSVFSVTAFNSLAAASGISIPTSHVVSAGAVGQAWLDDKRRTWVMFSPFGRAHPTAPRGGCER